MVPSGSSQNIIKHAKMAFRFQLPVGNEGLFVVITTNQGYRTKSVAVNADGTS